MAARGQDFEMFSGEQKELAIAITDDAGAAVDLTGVTVRWSLARTARSAPLIEKVTGDGIVVTDAAGGACTVTLVPADTEALEGDYYHEAEVTDGAGRPTTVLHGRARIKPNLI